MVSADRVSSCLTRPSSSLTNAAKARACDGSRRGAAATTAALTKSVPFRLPPVGQRVIQGEGNQQATACPASIDDSAGVSLVQRV